MNGLSTTFTAIVD